MRAVQWGTAAIILAALACAMLVQPLGCTQTSHYALVKSLDAGTARIDPYQEETCDKAYIDGHFYSIKAPGVAFASLPLYSALDALGLVPRDPQRAIWILGVWAAVIPTALLLLLVTRVADHVARGTGAFAAITLGLGTMVLPFATLLFSHALSALLAFAAFALLFRSRRPAAAAAAGVLAGLATLTEYPLALVAVFRGAYALTARPALPRAAAYVGGGIVGIAPLLAYNAWAFGSMTHMSYEDVVITSGQTGHDIVGSHDRGFFGITAPGLHVAMSLLLSQRGLLTLSPVLVGGIVGLVLLHRRGFRTEAWLIGAISLAFVAWNAGVTTTFGGPFGGDSPGPRYLVPILPFLALGVAATCARAPLPMAALALVSMLAMIVATATQPMLGNNDTRVWAERLMAGDFVDSVVTIAGGGHGWLAIAPFFVLVALAAACAGAAGIDPSLRRTSIETTGTALAAWAVVSIVAPDLLEGGATLEALAALALLAAAVAAVLWIALRPVTAAQVPRRKRRLCRFG